MAAPRKSDETSHAIIRCSNFPKWEGRGQDKQGQLLSAVLILKPGTFNVSQSSFLL